MRVRTRVPFVAAATAALFAISSVAFAVTNYTVPPPTTPGQLPPLTYNLVAGGNVFGYGYGSHNPPTSTAYYTSSSGSWAGHGLGYAVPIGIAGGYLADYNAWTRATSAKIVNLSNNTAISIPVNPNFDTVMGNVGTSLLVAQANSTQTTWTLETRNTSGTNTPLKTLSGTYPQTWGYDATGLLYVTFGSTGGATLHYFTFSNKVDRSVASTTAQIYQAALGASYIAWTLPDSTGHYLVRREPRTSTTVTTMYTSSTTDHPVNLGVAGSWVAWQGTVGGGTHVYLEGSPSQSPTAATLPGGCTYNVGVRGITGFGNYFLVLDGHLASDSGVYRLTASTSPSPLKLVSLPTAAYSVSNISNSGGQVAYTDNRATSNPTYQRSISSGGTYGSESVLSSRSTGFGAPKLSAGWAVTWDEATTNACGAGNFDQRALGAVVHNYGTQQPDDISAARASYLGFTTQQVVNVYNAATGASRTVNGVADALWGPYLAVENSDNSVQIYDLRPSTPAVVATPFPAGTPTGCQFGPSCQARLSIWGDWVAWSFYDGGLTQVRNWRSLATPITIQGGSASNSALAVGLSDGVVAWTPTYSTGGVSLRARPLPSGSTVVVANGVQTSQPNGMDDHNIDGPWVSWLGTNGYGNMTNIGFGGTSAPRVLDAGGRASIVHGTMWTGYFDTSKPLSAWSVVIKSGSNVIQTTSTPADTTGTVKVTRTFMTPGTYTWTFTGHDASSNAIVGPDGNTATFTGTITVT